MPRRKSIDDTSLLAVAREVFLRDGAFGSTVEIARRAGLSEAAIFKRFPTKAALFVAALVPPPLDMDVIIGKARAAGGGRAGIDLIAEAMLGYLREALPVALVLMHNPLIGADVVRSHLGPDRPMKIMQTIAAWFAGEVKAGRMSGNPGGAAALLFSSLHSAALFELTGFHGGAIPADGIRMMIDTLWSGIQPDAAPLSDQRKDLP